MTMIENKNIPPGMYIRKCETGLYNKQHFAKKADEERDLRLLMRDPKNWLNMYFSFAHEKEEIVALIVALANKLSQEGYDVAELEDWAAHL
jgi:hypothetical protein